VTARGPQPSDSAVKLVDVTNREIFAAGCCTSILLLERGQIDAHRGSLGQRDNWAAIHCAFRRPAAHRRGQQYGQCLDQSTR
jgi:hypothetical protein